MARLYRDGEIGRVLYAEGEHVHPMSYAPARPSRRLRHWRNNLPATYYCTSRDGAADGDHRHDAGRVNEL
jgi:hypothetical protein